MSDMNKLYLEQVAQEEKAEKEKEKARVERLGIGGRTKEFLVELSKLTKKYDIEIGGCGCCDSPYLTNTKTKEDISGNLYFNETFGAYETDKQPFEVQKEHTREQLTSLNKRVEELEKLINKIFELIDKSPEERANKIFKELEQMQKKFEEIKND